jgi:hypothetical protein
VKSKFLASMVLHFRFVLGQFSLKILAICSKNALLNIEITNHGCTFIDFIMMLFRRVEFEICLNMAALF